MSHARATQTPLARRAGMRFDGLLLGAVLALLAFGLVMVASASLHLGERAAGEPFHYVFRHLFALALGLGLGGLVAGVPIAVWEKSGPWLFLVGMALLGLVMLPGVGRSANGATRWIALGGFNLQPSEFMKWFAVIYIAGYLNRRRDEVEQTTWGFVKPMLLLALASGLIMLQPDFGTTAVLMAVALGMLFLGGASLRHYAVLLGLVLGAAVLLVLVSSYRLKRVTVFLDPWSDVNGAGYQLAQALIAFGRGGIDGVGLGNGVQKLFYLPEAHTDFLMAVIGEEFGLVGTLCVIAAFALITWRVFAIGARAEAMEWRFAAYTAYGFGIWIGLQAFINIGVNLGLLPTKGITLPFMSYGGNAILVACVIVAIVLRIDFETRIADADDELRRRNRAAPAKPEEEAKWARV